MSSWTDRVTNHALHTERNNLEQTFERIEQLDVDSVAVTEDLGRIRHVLRFVGRAIDAVDPELLTQAMLDGLHSRLAQLHAQLQQYEQSKSPAALTQANAQADLILDNVYQLPRLVLDDVVGVRESVTDMRRSMGQLVRHLREEADASAAEVKALRSATETLKTEIQNREVRLDNAVQRVQDTFAETQVNRPGFTGDSVN